MLPSFKPLLKAVWTSGEDDLLLLGMALHRCEAHTVQQHCFPHKTAQQVSGLGWCGACGGRAGVDGLAVGLVVAFCLELLSWQAMPNELLALLSPPM